MVLAQSFTGLQLIGSNFEVNPELQFIVPDLEVNLLRQLIRELNRDFV